MKIAIVLGTAREGNQSEKVAKFVESKIKEQNIETEFVDVADYLFTRTVTRPENNSEHGQKIEKWANIINESDAVIFVTPEYNHSYPGELKNLIDSIYSEYTDKPAGIVSVSMGSIGGARVAELLKLLLVTVNFRVINKSVLVSKVQDLDLEQDDSVEKQLLAMLEEIQKA